MFEKEKPTTFLNLASPKEPKLGPMPAEPPPQKDPGMAFLLSLLVPGAGQLYCDKKRRALWTFLVSLLCVAGIGFAWPRLEGSEGESMTLLLGISLRTFLVLYAFGFLDAYFTAQEIHSGDDQYLAYNPRVAAVLNLLTRGFGYWYVDQRGKAWVLFFLIGAASRASMKMKDGPASTALELIIEFALAVLAVDAYRIARQENEKQLSRKPQGYGALIGSSGLNPAIPVALACVMVSGYIGLIALNFVMPDFSAIDQTQAKILPEVQGTAYVNPKHGVEMHVPLGWKLSNDDKANFVEAETGSEEDTCHVTLLADATLPFVGVESHLNSVLAEVQKKFADVQVIEQGPSLLGGSSGQQVVIRLAHKIGELKFPLQQKYAMAQKGLAVYALIETTDAPPTDSCKSDLAKIRERLVLPK
jgi:TM2 domain-containing membrane protein YozV